MPVSDEGVWLARRWGRRCLARRYFGPRKHTGAQWADFLERLPPELREQPRLGFAYDDPRVTPPERIRHDCALEMPRGAPLTDAMADDGFDVLRSPGGLWAMIDVPARDTAEGYRAIFDGWFRGSSDYAMEGDPYLERHRMTVEGEIMVTVCVRVRSVLREGDWNMAVVPADGAVGAAS